MPVKRSGPGLLNPVTPSQENYLRSTQGSTELVWSVTGGGEFSNADHLRTLIEERRDGKKERDVAYEYIFKVLASNLKGTDKRLLISAKITSAWLSVSVTTVLGTVISAT